MRPILVTHCGAGSRRDEQEVADAALAAGMSVLRRGGSALDAVEASVVVLEDDPRTNAGTGSRMRIDGSIQMDAALMDSRGRAGAVAAIERVRNPIRVARKVMDTPHILLAGEGAIRFARLAGFPEYDPATVDAREQWGVAVAEVRRGKVAGFPRAWLASGGDTVGAVARDARGRYAAGSSTGGVAYMLPGRVGDSPIFGAGLWAGPAGAVTATGVGEEIWRRLLSKTVYDRIEGVGARRACAEGLAAFPRKGAAGFRGPVPIGVIAVDARGAAEACNRDMAWATNAPVARERSRRTKK